MKKETQFDKILKLINQYCHKKGSRTFTFQELMSISNILEKVNVAGNTPEATIRRLLQELRDQNHLSFLEKRGNYTLNGIKILENEVQDYAKDFILKESNIQKREYLIELYARDRGWVKSAKKTFGYLCMYPKCKNTFLKQDGTRYIEVHHIVPLCKGGNDDIWNLSVLCAHHHRMAHYAEIEVCKEIEEVLQNKAEELINRFHL